MGLYIAREIARGHGGTLVYEYHDPLVVFVCTLPLGGVPVNAEAA